MASRFNFGGMKLYVYGEFGPMALEKSFVRHWKRAEQVDEVVQCERLDQPKKFAWERIVRRFWPAASATVKTHNAELLRRLQPGGGGAKALVVFKGMELFPETLQRAKARGIALYCFNPDHPFVYSGRGSGSKFMTDSLGMYDRYFTYHRGAQTMLEERGVPHALIPFGYEEEALAEPFVLRDDEILRGCFIGNPNPLRARFLKEVVEHIPLDLYGNGWHRHFGTSPHVRVYGPVHDAEHWRIMARYRFQLNLMAQHNTDAHNMRTFSAPAAGAIVLAPRNADHQEFFHDGQEVILFDHAAECIHRAQWLLQMPFAEAMEMRKAARQRSIASGYAYAERARAMLEFMHFSTPS